VIIRLTVFSLSALFIGMFFFQLWRWPQQLRVLMRQLGRNVALINAFFFFLLCLGALGLQ
jgi:hypothetical protein